ncbi:MAG TPA: hypothetical protein VGG64_15495 [Pirellulales bacterium]|jgi:4-amino-4-deoxy-L-arabinose transferase-like glycosyltransferase
MKKAKPQKKPDPPPAPPPDERAVGVARWAAPTVIGLAAIAMMYWTWGRWPDAVVDFGRELYTPWRLTEGEVLYRDLAYFNGPLSPYVNAVWFGLFGVSLRVLALANFAILGVLLAILYSLLMQVGSRTSAFVGCLTFVLIFGFSRYSIVGNYNYICPYSHEMTHGLVLSLAAMFFIGRYARGGRLWDVAWCGLCSGLVFLTKPEFFVAIGCAAPVGIALAFWAQKQPAARLPVTAAVYIGPLLLPAVMAVALLSLALPMREAVLGTLGGFRWMFSAEIVAMPFYRQTMGLLDPAVQTGKLLGITIWYGILWGIPAAIGFAWGQKRDAQIAAATACFVAIAGGLGWYFKSFPITDAVCPLPVCLLAALGGVGVRWLRQTDPQQRAGLVLPISLLLFSLLLLGKIILFVRITHYGFSLAMPGVMLLIVAVWDWVPQFMQRFGGCGYPLRGAFLGTLSVLVAYCMNLTAGLFGILSVQVGSGADAFWADARGNEVNRILEEIDDLAPVDATLAVAPEGIMLNYLSRRVNPTPYVTLMPVEVMMFGEQRILEAFQQHPPDFLVLSDQEMKVYGFHYFGQGYTEQLFQWLYSHYHRFGKEPVPAPGSLRAILFARNMVPQDAIPGQRSDPPSDAASDSPE